MPRDALGDTKKHLMRAFALLHEGLDALTGSEADLSLRSRLIVARECIRDAIAKVEHAEEAILGETPEPCDGTAE